MQVGEEAGRLTNRRAGRQKERQADGSKQTHPSHRDMHAVTQTDRQREIDGRTDRQTYGRTGTHTQTDGQTNKLTD